MGYVSWSPLRLSRYLPRLPALLLNGPKFQAGHLALGLDECRRAESGSSEDIRSLRKAWLVSREWEGAKTTESTNWRLTQASARSGAVAICVGVAAFVVQYGAAVVLHLAFCIAFSFVFPGDPATTGTQGHHMEQPCRQTQAF